MKYNILLNKFVQRQAKYFCGSGLACFSESFSHHLDQPCWLMTMIVAQKKCILRKIQATRPIKASLYHTTIYKLKKVEYLDVIMLNLDILQRSKMNELKKSSRPIAMLETHDSEILKSYLSIQCGIDILQNYMQQALRQ